MARWVSGLVGAWFAVGVMGGSLAEATILINELLADPPAGFGDANRDGVVDTSDDEFLELVNTGSEAAALSGWRLADAVGVRHVFAAGASIPARGFFVVFGGGAPSGFADAVVASTGRLALNNAGDTVSLLDPLGSVVGLVTYGSEGGRDTSLTRWPDATGPFVRHATVASAAFSPGTTVDGREHLPLPQVPEPTSGPLVGLGLVAMRWCRRAARQRQ